MELPEGWTHEEAHYGTIIHKPDCGYVTIDFDKRGFTAGCGPVYQHQQANTKTYSGRGWKESLIRDAVAYLDRITS